MTLSAIRVASGQGLRQLELVGEGFLIQDRKAGTGGSSSVGANTRDLNTEVVNTISGAVLGTDQFTLAIGTYEITAKAPCHNGERNRLYLYNVTDAAEELVGVSCWSNTAGTASGATAWLDGRFTIAGTKTFEIRHDIAKAKTTNGLGVSPGGGVSHVFTSVFIRKV